ncbi:MAG: ABC transporter ATP-binding protein, partial [Pseudomonadota bacterium]
MSNKGLLPRPFRRQRLSILLSLLLNGFCQALSVLTMAWLLSSGLTVEDGVIRIAPVTAVSLLALASALIALRTSERASAERLGQLYVTSCRTRLYRALASQPVSGAPVSRLGLNMTRMITDLTALKNWVGYGIAQLAVSAMSLIGVVVAIFFVSPVLATAAANTIMLLLVLGTAASIYLGVAIRSARRIRGRLAANVGGQMLAPRLAQHFQRDQREKRRIRDQSITMTNELSRWRGIAGFMRSLPDATFPLIVVSLGLGVYLQATPISLDVAELTTIFLLIGLLVSPLRGIMLSLEYYMAYREGRYRLETVLGRYETRDRAHNPKVDECPGAKVLSFQSALPGHDPPLANVSLARGETALLTGVSGSGKTAFMNLIAGLNESAHPESPISQLAIDHFTMDSMSRMQWHAKT